jgi:hypothetical protein
VTREEMLTTLGIGDADFRDYLTKIAAFQSSLNANQLAFFKRTLPTVSQVAADFGPGVTTSDIEGLCAEAPPVNGIACIFFAPSPHPPPPPPPPPPPGPKPGE